MRIFWKIQKIKIKKVLTLTEPDAIITLVFRKERKKQAGVLELADRQD